MLDFIKLAQSRRIPYILDGHHHCHAGWLQTHCPFCAGGMDGWHLGFSLDNGTWNCWRCGALKFWVVIPALLRADEQTCRQLLRGYFKDSGPRHRRQVARLPTLKPPPDCGELSRPHQRYLEGRGFDSAALAERWSIQSSGRLGGRWAWRVIIPIRNGDERIVAYQGRAIGDVKPKYRMTDESECLEDPTGFLYGIERADGESVIIVEGVPGVWRLGPGCVATLGIDWKKQQANRLRRFKNRFILFDPEPVAQRQAETLAAHLSLFPGSTEIITGFTTDPGDFTEKRAARVRRELGLQVD